MGSAKKLKKVSAWITDTFTEDSKPSQATVRRWIDNGDIPGETIGGMYYVDVSRLTRTGNATIDRILAA